jgi:hypothetical protein
VEDEKEIEVLKHLVNYVNGEKKSDLVLRNELISMMVDLSNELKLYNKLYSHSR